MIDNEKENKTNVKKETTKKTASKVNDTKTKTVKKSTPKKSVTSKKESIVKKKPITDKKTQDNVKTVEENIQTLATDTVNVVDSIGKTIDDGLNKLDEKINSMDTVNLTVEVPKDKNIINNVIALFTTFIMLNVKWIKYKVEFFGYESSTSITILHTDMFDLSFMFGLGKICAIFSILLFFVNIVNTFIKLDEHITVLKKYNLDKFLPFSYYGLYLASLFCTLIGVLFTKYSYFTVGYIVSGIIYIISIYITFKGGLIKHEKNTR